MSRVHAELRCTDGAWIVEDLGSKTGTFVMRGGKRWKLLHPEGLRHEDRICVGKTILKFDCPANAMLGATDFDLKDTIALTPREQEVLTVLCERRLTGLEGWPTDRELAERFVLSADTIRTHLKSLYRKFGLQRVEVPENQRRSRLIQRAVDEGWVRPSTDS